MIFRYEAVDKTGKVLRGAMDVANEQAVVQRLASMGLTLKAVLPTDTYTQVSTKTSARQAAPAVAGPSQFPVSVKPIVSLGALARFYRQLATLVRSGMPIFQSLDELSNTTSNVKLKRACADMKNRVQQGGSLSSAMALYPNLFPVHTVGVIWGGELGGYLDVALDEAATTLEQENKDNRFASIGWFIFKSNIFLFILCIPTFAFDKMLKVAQTAGSTDASLHAMWQIYTQGFVRYCIPAFIVWIVFAYTWGWIKRIPSVRKAFDGCLLAIPIWGHLHKARSIERFLRTLHRQYQAGVAPAQAWGAASTSVRNSELASRLRMLNEMLRHPEGSLQAAFTQSRVLSVEDAGMVAVGEKSGSVPEMLERLAEHHKDEAANVKNFARLASVIIFNLAWIIPSGLIMILVLRSYAKFFIDAFNGAF